MNENVNVCITPKGDKPVLHFSQFDNERVFTVTVLADDGESAAVLTGLDIEFRLRKTDSHVVTIAPESVADNVITFKTTEQMCACCGQNIASVVLMKDDLVISTLDILVDIQRDILSGGLTSESDIRNLTTQLEQIVPEVVGDDYYNKQEVDDLLAEHTFDPSNYYDKQDVDELIAEHTFDPSNYYDKNYINTMYWTAQQIDQLFYRKTETDNLLADKADKSAIASLIVQKDVVKAPIASFNTDLAEALTKCIVDINPVQEGTGTPSPQNVRPIIGFSALNVTRTGVNLWDEQWELGGISPDGNNIPNTERIRSKNFIPIKPNLSVFIHLSDSRTISFYICEYDINKTFIQRTVNYKNTVFTTSANCCFIRFFVYSAGNPITTYGNNISINYPSSDTEYHAYNGQTASVNFGQTVYGGVADVTGGKVNKTHGIVDLGTLTWAKIGMSGGRYGFRATIPTMVLTPALSVKINAICEGYEIKNGNEVYLGNIGLAGWGVGTHDIAVYDDTLESGSAADFKTAINGIELVFELATPIEITTTPENLTALSGQNNVYGDTNGDMTVRFTETIGNELGV